MVSIKKFLLRIPAPLRYTIMLQGIGFLKIPLIFFIRPKVVCLDDEKCVLRIAFKRKVKSHLNAMYFGALVIAAECTAGIALMKEITESGERVSLVFKNFNAEFLKRVESDAYFTCENMLELKKFVAEVVRSGQRQELPLTIIATCPEKFGDNPVATFSVIASLKRH